MVYIHIGVGFSVVCFEFYGQCESLDAWNGQQRFTLFLCPYRPSCSSVLGSTGFYEMSVPTDMVIPGTANAHPCNGVTSDALPETAASDTISKPSSETGVSTKNTLFPNTLNEKSFDALQDCPTETDETSAKQGGGISTSHHQTVPLSQGDEEQSSGGRMFAANPSPVTVPEPPLTIQALPPSLNVQPSTLNVPRSSFNDKHWYALRTTYSREQQAYDYITAHGGTAYLPTINVHKEIEGKHVTKRESRIPNILFAYGTLQEIQHFVYDNINLPYLRFYYSQERFNGNIVRRPLIVPERQMESLRILCAIDDGNIALVPQTDTHFHKGQEVRITQGRFAGITGRVARYQGQQRVAVIIDGLITIATAYIPTAFLIPIND